MSESEPLTPPDADLQDFPFMPLHVARLRDSDLAAEEHPEACWYAVMLWAASWHQLPAGSLPDNDIVLCKLVGLGRDMRTFKKHRAGMLRGFVKCDDGRLYHPVVAEQVREAWKSKLQQRHRTLCAAIRKHNERNPENKVETTTFEEWTALSCPTTVADHVTALSRVTPPENECDIASKRQGQGQGQGDIYSDTDVSGGDAPPEPADPAKVMFDSGIRLLGEAGIPEAKARQHVGKWKRDHPPEAVIVALGKAQREGAIDPVSFITACLETANGNRPRNAPREDPIFAARRNLGIDELLP